MQNSSTTSTSIDNNDVVAVTTDSMNINEQGLQLLKDRYDEECSRNNEFKIKYENLQESLEQLQNRYGTMNYISGLYLLSITFILYLNTLYLLYMTIMVILVSLKSTLIEEMESKVSHKYQQEKKNK